MVLSISQNIATIDTPSNSITFFIHFMNLTITIVAVLMIIDALFTLVNLSKVESLLHRAFPNLDIKKVAIIEGFVGFIIISIKISTHTLK